MRLLSESPPAMRCTCRETVSSALSWRRCSRNSTSIRIAATPQSRQSRTMIDIKVVYSSDAFSLVTGPSSAIARESSIADYGHPPTAFHHIVSESDAGQVAWLQAFRHLQRTTAVASPQAAGWRPWQTRQKPLTSHLPARSRIKSNADASRPRADGRAASACRGCARPADPRHPARAAAGTLRARGLARTGVRRLRNPPAVRQAHAAADAGRADPAGAGAARRGAGARDRNRFGLPLGLPGAPRRPGAQPGAARRRLRRWRAPIFAPWRPRCRSS